MTETPSDDPRVCGIPGEFTAAKAMVPALFAGACRALIDAATCGSDEDGHCPSPDVLVRAEHELHLWLGVARYEQRQAQAQAAATAKALGFTPQSS